MLSGCYTILFIFQNAKADSISRVLDILKAFDLQCQGVVHGQTARSV